jgi:hypothetical protein
VKAFAGPCEGGDKGVLRKMKEWSEGIGAVYDSLEDRKKEGVFEVDMEIGLGLNLVVKFFRDESLLWGS